MSEPMWDPCPNCLKIACTCPSLDQVPHMPGDDWYLGDDGKYHPPERKKGSAPQDTLGTQSNRTSLDLIDDRELTSWSQVDIEAVLDGTWTPAEPLVGKRADGHGLLYPGRIHTIAGESEAGKGWFLVAVTLTELAAGYNVVYVDFEDEVGAVVGRMLAAGAKRQDLRDRFAYIRPEGPVGAPGARADLQEAILSMKPSVVMLDGVTEAMGLHGLDPLKNAEVAQFGRMLPRWIAGQGPAVLASDHVTKSGEGRGRYAIGAVHKLNAVDGAAYLIENRKAFGIGMTGRSTLLLAKDRPGALRQQAKPSAGGLYWYADLVMHSRDATFVEIELAAPSDAPAQPFRPTVLMTKVSAAMGKAGQPLPKAGIEERVRGKAQDIRQALAALVDEGFVTVDRGERGAQMHRLVRPFVEESSSSPGRPSSSQDGVSDTSSSSPTIGDEVEHSPSDQPELQVVPDELPPACTECGRGLLTPHRISTGLCERCAPGAPYCKSCGMTAPRHTGSCRIAKEASAA